MLNIYFGSEAINKEKFIFENVKKNNRKTIILVPDQFTLEAERQALKYMETQCIINVEVLSLSRLGYKLDSILGSPNRVFINKTGRGMLLKKILMEKEEELLVYKGKTIRGSFIDEINELIARFKSFKITSESLTALYEMLSGSEVSEDKDDTLSDAPDSEESSNEKHLLRDKLHDLSIIYEEYSRLIDGRFTDTDDYGACFEANIEKWNESQDYDVWIYAFDSIIPKDRSIISKLIKNCNQVNLVLSCEFSDEKELSSVESVCGSKREKNDVYAVTKKLMSQFAAMGKEEGFDVVISPIDRSYVGRKRPYEIELLRNKLFGNSKGVENDRKISPNDKTLDSKATSLKNKSQEDDENLSMDIDGGHKAIKIVAAANGYNEAESAASYILSLVRDEGYRYRDIMVICNDQERMNSISERIFFEYGIKYFADRKRNIDDSPVIAMVLSLIEVSGKGFVTPHIFSGLKSELTEIDRDSIELLEIYATKYKIRGDMWKSEFNRGSFEYSKEELDALNNTRLKVVEIYGEFAERAKNAETIKDYVTLLYSYLFDNLNMDERLEDIVRRQREQEILDGAALTEQMWGSLVDYFDQMVELIGEEAFDKDVFAELFKAGVSQIEIGILPPGNDDIIVGSLPRTRAGDIKAAIFLSVNDGILPSVPNGSRLLTADEEKELNRMGSEMFSSSDDIEAEERLSVYKAMVSPLERLYISYSLGNERGDMMRPSTLIEDITEAIPNLKIERDIISSDDEIALIGGQMETLRHLTEKITSGEKLNGTWEKVKKWYEEKSPNALHTALSGVGKGYQVDNIPGELATELYCKEGIDHISLSPSRLEKFSACPFQHFVTYGLKPKEDVIYQADYREIGDLYHNSIMKLCRLLEENNRWSDMGSEELQTLLKDIVEEEASAYKDGVFVYSPADEYKVKRVLKAIYIVALALIEQWKAGRIEKSFFEEKFGVNGLFPPISIDDGKVLIEGKIDRVDLLSNGNVKIIDYKTGSVDFSKDDVIIGYRLQLFIYLRAALSGNRKPAGVFYFKVREQLADGNKNSNKSGDESLKNDLNSILSAYRMSGLIVDRDDNIEQIAGALGPSESSIAVKLKKKQNGEYSKATGELIMSEADFESIQDAVDIRIENMAKALREGDVSISPMLRKGSYSVCDYCLSKDICRFEK